MLRVDAFVVQVLAETAGERVVAESTNHGHVSAGAGGCDCLVRSFASADFG